MTQWSPWSNKMKWPWSFFILFHFLVRICKFQYRYHIVSISSNPQFVFVRSAAWNFRSPAPDVCQPSGLVTPVDSSGGYRLWVSSGGKVFRCTVISWWFYKFIRWFLGASLWPHRFFIQMLSVNPFWLVAAIPGHGFVCQPQLVGFCS